MTTTTYGGTGGTESWHIGIGQLPTFTPSGTVAVSFPGVTYQEATTTATAGAGVAGTFFSGNTPATSSAIGPSTFTLSIAPIGSGNAVSQIQPTILVNKIIKW
jgi:hypothetical protein